MKKNPRNEARRDLRERLSGIAESPPKQVPCIGWIKTFRKALGMTAAQLAKRLHVDPSAVIHMEKREAKRDITLSLLDRVAKHLNCRLIYYYEPLSSLDKQLEERARTEAFRRLNDTSNNMDMDININPEHTGHNDAQIYEMVEDIISKNDRRIWDLENDVKEDFDLHKKA